MKYTFPLYLVRGLLQQESLEQKRVLPLLGSPVCVVGVFCVFCEYCVFFVLFVRFRRYPVVFRVFSWALGRFYWSLADFSWVYEVCLRFCVVVVRFRGFSRVFRVFVWCY